MKKTFFGFALTLLLGLAFTSCDPNDNHNGIPDQEFEQNFGAGVSRDFIGQVVDMENHAVSGATVNIGSTSVQTDVNGVFVINGANVREKFAYVRVVKSGYFEGSRALVPTLGKNNVRIMMIPATPIATVNSGESGTVELPDGSKIVFDGAFADENGNAYSGSVSVAAFHLRASDADIAGLMPGMLYGQGEDGKPKVLRTFGMINVEMRGNSGQKLNLATGHTAQISMKIDYAQAGNAPAVIPLWHFDQDNGYWKEDGGASKQNGFYIGNVSHFSWWNVDIPFPLVTLYVSLKDASGNPVTGVKTTISVPNIGYASEIGLPGSNGMISGLVPADQALVLSVYDLCGNLIVSQNIGPFSTDATLPDVVIPSTSLISGTLLNCDGNLVSNGYALFNMMGYITILPVDAGVFSLHVATCPGNNGYSVLGADEATGQMSVLQTFGLTGVSVNLGDILVCGGAPDSFLDLQFDGGAILHYLINVNAKNEWGFAISGSNSTGDSIELNFLFIPTPVTGTFALTHNFNIFPNYSSPLSQYNTDTADTCEMTINISQYEAVGGYMAATFSGTFTNTTGTHTLQGACRGIRIY